MQLQTTFIAGCFEHRDLTLDNPANTIEDVVWDDEGSSQRAIRVTHKTAQHLSAWWQGITVIANDVAQLPLVVYRRLDQGKERATDHPAYRLLHRTPNPETGPFIFKHLMQFWCASWGNAYAFIDREGLDVVGLYPLEPQSVTPFRADGELFYAWHDTETGQREVLFASEVFHLRGPGDDGLQGKSVFKIAKDSLSVGLEAQRFGAQFFKNNAAPGVTLEFPNAIKELDAKAVLKHWQRRHGGSANAARPALLDRGGKATSYSASMDDSQWLGSREFTRSEIASWLNVPPHKVGDLTRATFSNIEQQSIDYVVFSLMAWLVRWQDECNVKLFRPSETKDDTYFCEFVVDALLRGDYNSRMDGHTKSLQSGIRNIDEVRSLENLNPLPDGAGQKHFFPLNMQPVDEPRQAKRPQVPKEAASRSVHKVIASQLESELQNVYRRLGNSATRAAGTPGKLQAWLSGTLEKNQRTLLEKQLRVVAESAQQVEVELPTDDLLEDILGDYRRLIAVELEGDPGTLKSRLEELTKKLTAGRPMELAQTIFED